MSYRMVRVKPMRGSECVNRSCGNTIALPKRLAGERVGLDGCCHSLQVGKERCCQP
jgi:hypothetical protein